MSAERLQKVLAAAGIASRRDCEELIEAGRVTVNGKVMTTLGARVDPESDEILVDGAPIKTAEARTYILLNKPTGVISTAEDTHSRPTVVEQVGSEARLFPVGRLDQDSEGLILLTDDGALTQRLTHPSYNVEKEYRALLDRAPDADALRDWRDGVELDGEMTAPAWVDLKEVTDEGAWVRIVLQEGRKRQIREVARLLGYEVHRLIRVREGSLSLGDLPLGQSRPLSDDEIEGLWKHVGGRPSADGDREDDGAPRRRRSIATLGAVASTRGPRSRDDRPREDRPRDDRPREDRPRREYADRPQRDDQPREDRPRAGGYGDRPQSNDRPRAGGYGDRPQSNDRPRSGGYGDRPQSNDRPRSGGYGQRDDRPRTGGYGDRPRTGGYSDRPRTGSYGGRPQSNDRPRTGGYGQRDDRPRTGGYGDRPQSNDRPRTGGYGDRPQSNDRPRTGGYGQRDDRPRSGGYGDRPQNNDRPRTGGYGQRDDRPRSGGYGDRPQGNDRPRTGGYGQRDDRPRTGGYGQRDDRPRSGGYGDRPQSDRPRTGGYGQRNDQPAPPRPEGRPDRPRRREESDE